MAKVPFSKLNCKINTNEIPVQIGEETIAVKQYLPVQEKLALIGRVIEQAHDQDQNFANPLKVGVFRCLEMVYAYTDISFTAKQKEDPAKLYDQLCSSGVLSRIWSKIPDGEREEVLYGINETIEAYYKYRNSVFGILDTINQDYKDLNFDTSEIQKNISDPENLKLLKDLLTKMG